MTTDPRRAAIQAWADAEGVKFSYGYIGNCSATVDPDSPYQGYPHNYDDRSWFVWFPELPLGLHPTYPRNQASVPLGRTADLPEADKIVDKVAAGYARLLDRAGL